MQREAPRGDWRLIFRPTDWFEVLWAYFSSYPGVIWVWLLGVLLSAIVGINRSSLTLSDGRLFALAATALLFGAFLAHAQINPWLGWLSLGCLGLEYLLLVWAGLGWPTLELIWAAVLMLVNGFDPSGVAQSGAEIRLLLQALALRGQTWLMGLPTAPGSDPLLLELLWGGLIWAGAGQLAWAGWGQRSAWRAVWPLGLLMAVSIFFAREPYFNVALFFLFSFLLQISLNYLNLETHWRTERIDFADHLVQDVGIIAFLLIAFITLGAFLVPAIKHHALAEAVQSALNVDPDSVNDFAASLGVDAAERSLIIATGDGGLPRSHLLGGSPQLSQDLVLRISTGELPPMPEDLPDVSPLRHYWQAASYDVYSSAGWASSALEERAIPAGESLAAFLAVQGPGRLLTQTVTLGEGASSFLYTSGQPLHADVNTQANVRAPDDLALVGHKARRYQAVSWLTQPSESQLRQASNAYPAYIAATYLTLPDKVPARVRHLAEELTANQPTAYDKALALEQYLRGFPYDLDVPEPPSRVEVADYFLFELQRGYCDYYATTMVVMARAVGLPARFAIGYASGDYDSYTASYRVTEAEAHSWAQIYFPEIGWVNFEPTAGLPALTRPQGGDASSPVPPPNLPTELPPPDPPSLAEQVTRWASANPLVIMAALVLVLLALWFRWDAWRLKRLSLAELSPLILSRLYRASERTGFVPPSGATLYEFERGFAQYLSQHQPTRKLWQRVYPQQKDLNRLIQVFVQLYYGPDARRLSQPKPDSASRQLVSSWLALRWRLFWAGLWLRGQRFSSKLFSKATPPSKPTSSPSVTGTMGQSAQ